MSTGVGSKEELEKSRRLRAQSEELKGDILDRFAAMRIHLAVARLRLTRARESWHRLLLERNRKD